MYYSHRYSCRRASEAQNTRHTQGIPANDVFAAMMLKTKRFADKRSRLRSLISVRVKSQVTVNCFTLVVRRVLSIELLFFDDKCLKAKPRVGGAWFDCVVCNRKVLSKYRFSVSFHCLLVADCGFRWNARAQKSELMAQSPFTLQPLFASFICSIVVAYRESVQQNTCSPASARKRLMYRRTMSVLIVSSFVPCIIHSNGFLFLYCECYRAHLC